MKTAVKVLSAISLACWAFLCVSAAAGWMQVEPIDYCLATGVLAFDSLFTIMWGE